MKRIFLAVPISRELQKAVLEWGKKHQNFPVRWLSGKNLHVTLVPPWYAPASKLEAQLGQQPENIPEIVSRLKTVHGKVSPFEISFNRVSFGPDPKLPRLIWAEGQTPPELLGLKNYIEDALQRDRENRPFKLHVTLSRFSPRDFSEFPDKNLNDAVQWKEQVTSFVLMESRLSSQGADYEVLEKFTL